FTPAHDRQLRVFADAGHYHHEAEWSMNIPHPVEVSRGQVAHGDAYSPGWFDLPMAKDAVVTLACNAEAREPSADDLVKFDAERGTMPNIIHGEDASNRDTSDAALWYGIVCEELAASAGADIYEQPVDPNRPRTVLGVLEEIANGYLHGTPNGIRVDPESALVW